MIGNLLTFVKTLEGSIKSQLMPAFGLDGKGAANKYAWDSNQQHSDANFPLNMSNFIESFVGNFETMSVPAFGSSKNSSVRI